MSALNPDPRDDSPTQSPTTAPEPPAEVWVDWGCIYDSDGAFGWVLSDDGHRYVLAPEGSAVIPPELVKALLQTWDRGDLTREQIESLMSVLRRDGAS